MTYAGFCQREAAFRSFSFSEVGNPAVRGGTHPEKYFKQHNVQKNTESVQCHHVSIIVRETGQVCGFNVAVHGCDDERQREFADYTVIIVHFTLIKVCSHILFCALSLCILYAM